MRRVQTPTLGFRRTPLRCPTKTSRFYSKYVKQAESFPGKMVGAAVSVGRTILRIPKWSTSRRAQRGIRAAQSMEDRNKVYKELGLFSLKRKIEEMVLRAEMTAPTALEFEQATRIKQEELMHEYNLWDDLSKSNEILLTLADTTKNINSLKDLQFKAEVAKLITELSEMDSINYQLFKQAYDTSVDVSKFLDRYEMVKLLSGKYDAEGACLIITAGYEGTYPEIWAERLLNMYIRWAGKQGHIGRVVGKHTSKGGGIKSATLEFEWKYAYGHLSGERGVHRMFNSSTDESILEETSLAGVEVIPLFLETAPDIDIGNEDLEIQSISSCGEDLLSHRTKLGVSICHIPTGITFLSSGERSQFANKIKALNRLKAKLLVIVMEQSESDIKNIRRSEIASLWQQETRRYVFSPYKLVRDMKTGIQLPDLTSVLDGNLEPLIAAHISSRQTRDVG